MNVFTMPLTSVFGAGRPHWMPEAFTATVLLSIRIATHSMMKTSIDHLPEKKQRETIGNLANQEALGQEPNRRQT
ncbi:hypothetical protein [Mesorhizobium sp. SARCC-RB16n]|uniref:hypothetical protein n=1 Tax=Mesorhizobium sp. SARCC-RB16n TaxID=2116687 RepID=UPI001664905C|nr:hypothetical protein [Mesorhizobium sp. SARCC-RB16n]